MYPDITPDLKVKSTISHPLRSEEVIGFVGRNTKLGREALVMKSGAVNERRVLLPVEAANNLSNGEGELAVLDGDKVLTMDGSDFAMEHDIQTIEGRGSVADIYSVDRDNEQFREWDESVVDVGN